jgi:hypothetical protein
MGCTLPASDPRRVACWQIRTYAALERYAAARGVCSIGDMLTTAAQGRIDDCQTLRRDALGR